MSEEDWFLIVETRLALHVSEILCHTPRQGQLDAIMAAFKPYLKELHALHRRSQIRRVK